MMHEALIFADDRPMSTSDDLYQWATDAETLIRQQHASLADAQAEIARLRGALEALEADAHLIFNNPPSECPQIARDVIEWYAGSIRVALECTL